MNIFCIGRKYQGKSTLSIHLAEQIRDSQNAYKVLVFDPKWKIKLYPHTDDMSEFESMLESKSKGLTFYPAREFSEDDSERVRSDFTEFCEVIGMDGFLKNPPDRPLVIVIDESYYLQGKGYLHPWLGRMIRLATEGKLFIIQAVHRPVDLTPDVRGKADELFIFKVTDTTDLRIIEELCGEQCAEIVKQLPPHHVLRFDVNRGTHEVWKNPRGWYIETAKEKPELQVVA